MRLPSERGFTLIELLVTLSIAAILLAIAVPSYSGSRLNSQLRASSNDLIGSINLARSEAIKGGTSVTLCASSDGLTCSGGWGNGWVVLRGADVLHTVSAIPAGFQLTESSGTVTLQFQSTGVDATPAVFTLCRSSPSVGSQERVVSMDATGRAFVRRTSLGACS
ncbi:GspH/FimT family pseudopilin [Steroidobacter flavus]|uniref:Type II secretion system protein H n=1 Tax=Steroidobacter flavus TaxID=1842136 RepID=A0ABV8SMJ5_9GAMM